MLANDKAVAPVGKFLNAVGVGEREGAKVRELEWERKTDQAVEICLSKLRTE